MFQMKSVEMVHWDFWQRLTVPLDAQIVTIIGPNGSGKTTLLDALRTLLAIKCSGKRDYKRYVRNNREPFAFLKGVVANPRRLNGGLYPTPFFPLLSEEVTLLCRIKKQGGDWVRLDAIAGAGAPLAALMLGINDFGERMNLVLGPEREPLKPWLAAVVAAARGHGLLAIDGVVNATDDADRLRTECLQGRAFGARLGKPGR